MEIYAKGQLSYVILNCLMERDFYGLDIISEVKDRSNGRILLKKPSVYSNLTRMEKQGQVSSYIQNSDLGPNRKYYSITEKGRQTFETLKDYFDRNGIDVFRDFDEDCIVATNVAPKVTPAPTPVFEETEEDEEEESFEQSDFFDFSSLEDKPAKEVKEEKVEQPLQDDGKFLVKEEVEVREEKPEPVQPQKQFSISSLLRNEEAQEEVKEEPIAVKEEVKQEEVVETRTEPEPKANVVEQPVFQESQQLSNQQIYDISKDINKYKRKRSFAEDQMAFAVGDPIERDDERTKQNIEELKSSILAQKGKTNERMSEEEFYRTKPEKPQPQISASARNFYSTIPTSAPVQEKLEDKVVSDDGVFIEQRLDKSQVAKAKKIEPPRLKIIGEKETPLPAPKRDNSVDLSHKEIISKLYSKSKGSNVDGVDDNYIYDYDDLQDYYNTQGISFKVYEKNVTIEKHNTNKLALISSLICLGLSLVATAMIFTALYLTGYIMSATVFLFVAFPMLAIAESLWRLYIYKKHTSWEPKPMLSQWLQWLFALLGVGAIIGLNFAFGLTADNWLSYSTTLFLPAVYILIYLPIYNFVKKTILVKHWR